MANKKEVVVEETKIEEIKNVKPVDNNNDYEEVSLDERIINIEKKAVASFWLNIITIILVFITLAFSMGGSSTSTETNGTEGTETATYDTSAFKKIAPSDIAKLSKEETMVVWVGRQSCGFCSAYAPYIEEAADQYGITAYYIDLAEMVDFSTSQAYITDAEEFNTLSALPGKGDWATFAADNVGGTPLTLIVKDGYVIGGLSGYAETATITAAFKDAGLKK